MAGLGFDDFFPPVISSKTHSIVDWIHSATNFAAAAMFYKRGDRTAGHGALALGASVLFNTMMTDYEYGVFRVWSFKTHGLLDYGVAAASSAFPALLKLDDPAAKAFFYAQGGGETLAAGFSNYNDNSGAERQHGSQSWKRRRYRDPWAA
jgi:hypothetical protein